MSATPSSVRLSYVLIRTQREIPVCKHWALYTTRTTASSARVISAFSSISPNGYPHLARAGLFTGCALWTEPFLLSFARVAPLPEDRAGGFQAIEVNPSSRFHSEVMQKASPTGQPVTGH